MAADNLGIYLQPELPFWGSFDRRNIPLRDQFLEKEDHQVGESLIAEKFLEHGVGDDVGVFLEEDHLMDLPPAERVRIAKLCHN